MCVCVCVHTLIRSKGMVVSERNEINTERKVSNVRFSAGFRGGHADTAFAACRLMNNSCSLCVGYAEWELLGLHFIRVQITWWSKIQFE